MLVAFLYDLQLLSHSNCEKSFDDLYRKLFAVDSKGQADANETIINLLNSELADPGFVRKCVQRVDPIEVGAALTPFGIEVHQDSGTKLSVGRPNASQKKLLKCLEHH
jgi:predicted metalloprotease with PDZ domain